MSLREVATSDLNAILSIDFTNDIEVTSPELVTVTVPGYTNDIARVIDPDTGLIVSGREASVAISLRALVSAGLGVPRGIEASTSKPWTVKFLDVDLNEYLFKVLSSNPDRALGIVTCELVLYND